MIVENPVLLIFNMDPAKEAALEKIVSPMHIAVKHMEEGDMKTPLGSLAGAKNWFAPAAVPPSNGIAAAPQELLVMCGIDERKLDKLLARLRAAGLMIPLKAILTETNAMWNAAALTAEIAAEREEILRRQR